MIDKHSILIPDATYHVYNRANGNEKLFLSAENYRYFFQKYIEHISPIADTFCYCLMPNHFHFLIRIKSEDELEQALGPFPKFETLEKVSFERLLSKRFSNLFSAYTQAFNKQQNRMGSLFMKNFKRIRVNDHAYLHNLVKYIHYNPIESGLTNKVEDWEYCSYKFILSGKSNFLNIKEMIAWFDTLENFKYVHQLPISQAGIEL
jgi:REP element-mobilizing transposase RayT